jgi:hypothetical protein
MITALYKTLHRTLVIPTLALVSCLCLLILVTPVYAGSLLMFGKKKIFLSPEIHGTLLNHGKPVPATEITRLLAYEDDHIDTAVTDANGKFYFPEVTIQSSLPNNPFDETRVVQVITIEDHDFEGHDSGSNIYLWGHQRGRITRVAVTDDRLSKIVFDLSFTDTGYDFLDPETGKRYYITGLFKQEGYIEKLTSD